MAEIHRWKGALFGRRVYSSSTSLFRFDCGSCFRTSLVKTRKFMPTTVTVVFLSIAFAPLFGYQLQRILIPVGLFLLVGLKRKVDEPRTRKIEGSSDWRKLSGDSN